MKGKGVFKLCISLKDEFGGVCGNCKWRDYGSWCSGARLADAVRTLAESSRIEELE
jgi:hypothetical protein